MSFKTLAYTTWLLHTAKKGLKFCVKKFSLNNSTSAILNKKGPPVDKRCYFTGVGRVEDVKNQNNFKTEKFLWHTLHFGGAFFKIQFSCFKI